MPGSELKKQKLDENSPHLGIKIALDIDLKLIPV